MKRQFLAFALLLCLFPLPAAAAATKKTAPPKRAKILKFATVAPKGTSFHVALQRMAQQWKSAPGGVNVTIHTDGAMGSESDVVRRMRLGQLHGALLTASGLAEIDPSATALQEMPMMFADLAEVDYVRSQMQTMISARLRSKGFVVLFWGDAGWVRFFSRKEAMTPAEFRSQRVFVTASDRHQADLMKKIGYNAVPLEFSDALTSLKTGMIDVIPTAPFHALAGQYFTVAKHMLELNWVPLVGALVVTSEQWDALPTETQLAFARAAAAAGTEIQKRGRAESDQAVAAMKKRGLVTHALTPQARREWEKVAKSLYPSIRGGRVPADVFDEVQRLLAARRTAIAEAR